MLAGFMSEKIVSFLPSFVRLKNIHDQAAEDV
jgi:hypothetical protein